MNITEPQPDQPAVCCRWYHFRLRTLLVVILLASIGVSLVSMARARKRAKLEREEAEAVEAIENVGGQVGHDYDLDIYPWSGFGGTVVSVGNPTNALWPLTDENLRELKGHLEGLPRLTTLDLRNTLITDAGLEHIAGLKQLDCLHLSSTSIRGDGLQHVENLTNLWMLSLDHTQVTDASLNHLRGLHRVQFLDLSDTKVTDEVVKKLQQALPNCKITR